MVHQYKLNGYNIVLDSESGCIHTVDDAAYDAIALYENTPAEDIISTISQRYDISEADVQEILDDIETLKKTTSSLQKTCSPDRPACSRNVSP